ncbi:peptidylprolyl isomerase [Campylobacter sp. MIT 97-5078]|uniref:peptidylprolyl isomerase n=1 Tax=Campylobacter sp. MIT 97-5078 TaxID=1548153 RepID=UPI0005145043|nr:peptidylprolyl isomerase [Campylobacter sp. MIT 97-5078]KGI56154.1 peptidylprolyl isomerase [Campylobacter sp. MIT 97-5078]TQR27961.1 peptidylprolyl isomerase [Campylobacter sp. MIT 97-5078]
MKKLSLITASLLVAGTLANAAVVASVNGKDITDTQVNEDLAPLLRGQSITTLPAQQKQMVLTQYIAEQLILEEAKKANVEKDPLYAKELERAKNQISMIVYQQKLAQNVKISDAQIKAFYDKNKQAFVDPAAAKARHILVENEAEAKNIINELKNLKGDALTQKFAELARTKSKDPGSAAKGGDLGWFDAQSMVKPFADAAFSLKKGEISKTPVKTQFGYHIILKEDSRARKQYTEKDKQVRDVVENELKKEEVNKILQQKAQELFTKAKVEIK